MDAATGFTGPSDDPRPAGEADGDLRTEVPAAPSAPAERPRSILSWNDALRLAAALALGIGAVETLSLIARPLTLLVIAITVAEALAPAVDRLNALVRRRTAVIVFVYLVLLGLLVLLGWLVVPALVAQGRELAQEAPGRVSRVQSWLTRLGGAGAGQRLAGMLGSWPERVAGFLVSLPVKIFSTLVDASLVVFLSVYWLIGGPTIRHFTLSLLPVGRRDRAGSVIHEMGRAMGGYIRGAAINAAIMGTLAWLGLTLIGIRYAVMLGVLTMLGEMVPVLGAAVVGAIVVAVALLQSFTNAVIALALFTALIQLEGHILTPNIMRSQTHVPQALVLFAIVVGAAVGGFLGILVSIPVAAAVRVLVLRVLTHSDGPPLPAPAGADAPAGPGAAGAPGAIGASGGTPDDR